MGTSTIFYKIINLIKKKIILHRASMKYYYDYLSKIGKYNINYINFNSDIKIK